jgi:hypothetical protein
MKNRKNFFVLLSGSFLVSGAILLYSCKKESLNSAAPAPTPTPSALSTNTGVVMTNYFKSYRNQTQQFTINAGSGGYVSGAEGSSIYFPPNVLLTQNGSVVTGQVNITLKEALTMGDMILNNLVPLSNGVPLVSGGEFLLTAAQGGNQLKIAAGQTISVSVPTSTPDYNMEFFKGSQMSDGSVNWNLKNGSISISRTKRLVTIDSAGGGYGYQLDSLGWSNFDRFANLPNCTSFYVVTPTGFVDTTTAVWVVFQNQNLAAPLTAFNSKNNSFQVDHSNTIPIGMQVLVVSIATINGQMYWSSTPNTITANQSLNITFTAKTKAQIEQLTAAL